MPNLYTLPLSLPLSPTLALALALALALTQAKADRAAAEAAKRSSSHRQAVVAKSQDEGITAKDLRYYHGMIRDHFATRFTQDRGRGRATGTVGVRGRGRVARGR